MYSYARALGLLIGCLAAAGSAHAETATASRDWRDAVIYFLMIDRFDDGEPGNNDQGTGEYDPADRRKFSGGDLAGVARRLDYIRGLGADAVWLTPPVANQWWDPRAGYGGYHGYWARDLKSVDAHFGTMADYVALGRAMDASGLALVQDIVVNHMGNYHGYAGAHDPGDPTRGFARWPDGAGNIAPSQPPFDRNNAADPGDRRASIYHFTPVIRDHADLVQEWTWQLADLDDLDTGNPVVRRALRDSYGFWIREAGVDAFRVDTAFYVPPGYFRDFLYARDRKAPGVLRLAKQLGRADFHVFGEGFGVDRPFDDTSARRIESYVRDERGRPLMPGMLNFPLYGSLRDVFAGGQGTDVLAHRITSMMAVHRDPHRMPTFVDNHDVDRFLAGGSESGLRQALLAMFALPGIPTIYYGTEQAFTAPRAAMFAAGHGSDGRDHFDDRAPLYRYIRALADLRRGHVALRRGVPVVRASAASAGAIAWTMGTGTDTETRLVAINSADTPRLLVIDDGLPAGSRWGSVLSIDGQGHAAITGASGGLVLELPARAGLVFERDRAARVKVGVCAPIRTDRVASLPNGDLRVSGSAQPGDDLRVVVDGDLGAAVSVRADARGRFAATVVTDAFIDPARTHELRGYRPADGCVGAAHRFQVARTWTPVIHVTDPAEDDRGRSGNIRYPDAPEYAVRPGDIRAVQVFRSGGSLRIELTMASILRTWNPANGFDHVALTAFLELPGQGEGIRVMPGQSGKLPEGMAWHRRWRAHGWSNALFGWQGAGDISEGRPLDGGARIAVDAAKHVIRIDLPASALGSPADARGARLYLNTWDYDGGYRRLTVDGAGFSFGGGNPGREEALVLDEVGPIRLDGTD